MGVVMMMMVPVMKGIHVISCARGNPADTRAPVLIMIKARRKIPMLEIQGRDRGRCCGDAHVKSGNR
jgi:hypothetical protein